MSEAAAGLPAPQEPQEPRGAAGWIGNTAEDDALGDLLGISDVSKLLEITPRTLRFYEDKGLITPRRVGTTRIYGRREVGRMRLILRGKRLGFSIREIGEFLDLYEVDRSKHRQMRRLGERVGEHLAQLEAQREAIDTTVGELREMARQIAEWLGKGE